MHADFPLEQTRRKVVLERVRVGQGPRLRQHLARSQKDFVDAASRQTGLEERHRACLAGIPVLVETSADVIDDTPGRDHVLIDEFGVLSRLVVLIGDIAAANDRDAVVYRERLVVHPPIQQVEVHQETQHSGTVPRERVEDANLNALVIVEHGQAVIAAQGERIIHQQTHTDTPACRLDQAQCDQVAADVIANQVTLDVDTQLGRVDQGEAGTECLTTGP